LDQAEDLGTEVLTAVRPAQAPTGDGSVPQVYALHPRGVAEDLVPGPRLRQVVDLLRLELERDERAGFTVVAGAVEVGAQGRADERTVRAQDAVLVERRDLVERRLQLRFDLLDASNARGVVGGNRIGAVLVGRDTEARF